MSESIQPGALYVVSTPIGNLEDITARAIAVLRGVDLVAAEDTRKTRFLLEHLGVRKPLMSYYSYIEERRTPQILKQLGEGKAVALVTDAGTPGISDPASVVVRGAIERGIPVVPVPGPTALLAALVVSGLPMDRFVFEGFLPVKKGRKTKWEQLRDEERTIVLYESPFRIVRTIEEIVHYMGDRRIAVARELTKRFEEVQRGSASEVLERLRRKSPRGEYVVVVSGSRDSGGGSPLSHNPARS